MTSPPPPSNLSRAIAVAICLAGLAMAGGLVRLGMHLAEPSPPVVKAIPRPPATVAVIPAPSPPPAASEPSPEWMEHRTVNAFNGIGHSDFIVHPRGSKGSVELRTVIDRSGIGHTERIYH